MPARALQFLRLTERQLVSILDASGSLDEIRTHGFEAMQAPHRELPFGLATRGIDCLEQVETPKLLGRGSDEREQLFRQLWDSGERASVGMDELGGCAEAKRGPAVLGIVTAVGGSSWAWRDTRAKSL
jgi:hypothetical protein